MNEFIKELKNRRSFRAYQDRPVEDELLKEIAEAGTYAPSAMGLQSPIIIVVTNKELRDRMSKLNAAVMNSDKDPFYGAPAVLVVLADKNRSCRQQDGSLVMGNMLLAADSLGLGSCWINRAKEVYDSEEGKAILKELGIEGEYEGVGNCIVGYPAEERPVPKPRKENYIYYAK